MGKVKHYASRIAEGGLREIWERVKWLVFYRKYNVLFMILFSIIGMCGTVVSLISSLVSRDLVDIITGHKTGELIKYFVMILVSQVVIVFISQGRTLLSNKISIKMSKDLKMDLYSRIMESDWEELSNYHSGLLLNRWECDSESVISGVLSFVPNLIILTFNFISSLIIVIKNDASFAVIAFLGVPISLGATKLAMGKIRKANQESMEARTKLSSLAQESFGNIQLFKAFNMVNLSCKRINESQECSNAASMKYNRISAFNSILMSLVAQLITYSTYGWGIYKVWNGSITYGTMTLFISLSSSLASATQAMLNTVPSAISLTNNAKRVWELMDLNKDDFSHVENVERYLMKNKDKGIGVGTFDLSFSYANGTEVLKDTSFEAHPNEVVALVGPSGEGKTTMLRLILAIVKIKEGGGWVCAGNSSIKDYPEVVNASEFTDEMYETSEILPITASTRQLFAYVPQGNTMFSGTIAENMRNVKEDATDEEIIKALKIACAWDFVEKLPDGINTTLQERGGGMSEGQSQRLSIARAILRKSPILLLDEVTSALDIATEKRVLKNIMEDDYPRTTIVTTHRPSVLTVCNRVYQIHDKGCKVMSKDEIDEMIRSFIS